MRSNLLPALVAAGFLAGCTTPSMTEVTRFHLGQPIPSDAIALLPAAGRDGASLEFRSQSAIVARDLDAVGLHPATDDKSGYIGTLTIEQSTRIGPAKSSPFQIGFGGSTGPVGGGVTVPIGGRGVSEVRTNLLALQIRRRSDKSIIWEGRAVQDIAADAPASALNSALPGLSKALLGNFPGPSGQTIKVKAAK